MNFGIVTTMISRPSLSPIRQCLNVSLGKSDCSRCADSCPAKAITFQSNGTPQLDESTCTSCTACIATCPVESWQIAAFDIITFLSTAVNIIATGSRQLRVACSGAPDAAADLSLPCHAGWDPLLLATLAGEGVQTLHIIGLSACATCPRRFGAIIMQQTEHDYAFLNKALEIQMTIIHTVDTSMVTKRPVDTEEPARRVFFRNLLPSLAQGMATTATQLGHATRYAPEPNDSSDTLIADTPPLLPLRLRLFIHALPKLHATFTPIPFMPSLPLGAIQVDPCCTACGDCVETCPTDALALKPFGAKSILEFKPDCCIGCQHCAIHCSQQAITVLPSISLPAIAAQHARPLIMVTTRC